MTHKFVTKPQWVNDTVCMINKSPVITGVRVLPKDWLIQDRNFKSRLLHLRLTLCSRICRKILQQQFNFKWYISRILCEIALGWMPIIHIRSILVQVMAWSRQATSHYLSQCWPKSMSPYMASLRHNELTRSSRDSDIMETAQLKIVSRAFLDKLS